jgi:hypothetical protein
MSDLPSQLRALHPLAQAGRPACFDVLLDAAREIERLEAVAAAQAETIRELSQPTTGTTSRKEHR